MNKFIRKIKWKKLIKFAIIIVVLVTAGYLGYQKVFANKNTPAATVASYTTSKVETRTIQNTLSSSGTVEPLNTYEVTTLVEGEVISADFEEGDTVEKGQVLYQITTDNVDNEIEAAQTKVARAEKELAKSKENYSDALDILDEANADYKEANETNGSTKVLAEDTGVVKTLFIKEGDTIQKGSQIAAIYDNSYMLLTIAFGSADVDASLIGDTAEITIDDSFETLEGKVTEVSNIDQTLSGNRLVKNVTIKVKNPGGITGTTTATASIDDIYSTGGGTFSVLTDTVVTSKVAGEVDSLKIEEGSKVSEGDVIFTLTQDSVDDQLSNYSNAVDKAQQTADSTADNVEAAEESLEDAETSLDDTIDSKTDYSITAPISGKVIRKDALAGDTIKNSGFSSTLCVIYDLSAVTFSMEVDELDVLSVKEGQEVSIVADALEDKTFTGVVTNISLESTASSGVTQYPVTVRVDDIGDLLPGMNVTGNIVIEEAKDCLAIPSDALQRGNAVYVKDESVKEANGRIPAGFKEVAVETGITDGDYVQITSGLDGSEEVYVARNISAQAIAGEESLLDGLGLGGSRTGEMPDRSEWSGGGDSRSGGNMGGGNFGGPQ
jgi:HlyD family secretion protein